MALQLATVGGLALFFKPHLEGNPSILVLLLGISNALVIFFLFLFTGASGKSWSKAFSFQPISSKRVTISLGIGVCAMFVSLGISGFLGLEKLDPEAVKGLEALVSGPFWLSLLAVGILAPISEELIFRGAILNLLKERLPLNVALVLQGLVFGIYHGNLVQAPPTAVLGIIMGFAVAATGSIWPAIIVHIVNNSLALSLSQLAPDAQIVAEAGPAPSPWLYLAIGTIGAYLVYLQLKKLRPHH